MLWFFIGLCYKLERDRKIYYAAFFFIEFPDFLQKIKGNTIDCGWVVPI